MKNDRDGLREIPSTCPKCPAPISAAIQAVRGKGVASKSEHSAHVPRAEPLDVEKVNIEITRITQLPKLTQDLIWWSFASYPAPAEAMWSESHLGDLDYERRCIGNMFRERARRDPAWFSRVCVESPAWVLSLSTWIKQANGYPPRGWTWRDWLEAIGKADDFDLIEQDISPATVALLTAGGRSGLGTGVEVVESPKVAQTRRAAEGGLFG